MREFKYKAYWHDSKLMGLVDTIEFLQGGIRVSDGCVHTGWAGSDCTLRQYTEIKNNDGKEIYNGDIVKLWQRTINGGYFAHICKVYQKENGTWMIEGHPEDDISYRTRLELYSHRNEVDVIGNIFENPELLPEVTTQ